MIKGNKYKHYKGGYYTIICKCMLESDLTEMVVYKCDKSNNIYTRPLEEFKEKFELVSSNYFLE